MNTVYRRSQGFTLIELVAVMVIAGIVVVAIGPRMFSAADSEVNVVAVTDSLMATARYTQQQAMYDPDLCYRLLITSGSEFKLQSSVLPPAATVWQDIDIANSAIQPPISARATQAFAALTVTVSGANTGSIMFDTLGNSVTSCGGSVLAGTIPIQITGTITRTINVCSTGYATTESC